MGLNRARTTFLEQASTGWAQGKLYIQVTFFVDGLQGVSDNHVLRTYSNSEVGSQQVTSQICNLPLVTLRSVLTGTSDV